MRELAGVIVKDVPRYVRALAQRGPRGYLRLCNRNERLEAAPQGEGVRCLWQWTSDLHAPRHLPLLGRWLMRRALADHPVRFAPSRIVEGAPQVAFIIGHRGEERVPLLRAVIEALAAQSVPIECIVVQQEREATLAGRLPPWVRLVHTPPPQDTLPYCRSWAFNVGARHARAPLLVLHDNDLLAPADYAAQLVDRTRRDYDVVNLKRFLFYLAAAHTRALVADRRALLRQEPEAVMQNAEAGGSIAITAEAFARIGGMDESFVGWGGEDNEFWERAQLLRVWNWADLPLVHLWHPSQPGKQDPRNPTMQRYQQLRKVDPRDRVAALLGRRRGDNAGPVGPEHQGARASATA
jgi:hypothetical protein